MTIDKSAVEKKKELPLIFQGTPLVFLGFIIFRGLEFITRSIIARLLGPGDFGIYSTSISIFSILGTVFLVGLPIGIVRFVAQYSEHEKEQKQSVISIAFWVVTIIGVISGSLVFIFSSAISSLVFHTPKETGVIRIIGISLPFFMILSVVSSVFQAEKKIGYHVLVNSIAMPVTRLILLLLIYFFYKVNVLYILGSYLFLSQVLSMLLAFFFARSYFPYLFKKIKNGKSLIKDILRFSLPLMIGGLLGASVWQMDIIFLQNYQGSFEAGLYSSALVLGRFPNMILLAFGFVITPLMARFYRRKKLKETRELYGKAVHYIVVFTLPLTSFFICFAPQIVEIFYGSQYLQATNIFRLLLVGYFFHIVLGPNGNTLLMFGYSKLYLVITVIATISSIILYRVSIPVFGMVGAALSTVAGLTIMNCLFSIQVFKISGINPFLSIRKRLFVIAIIVSALVLLLDKNVLLSVNMHLRLAINLFVFIFLYTSLSIIFKSLHLKDLKLFLRFN